MIYRRHKKRHSGIKILEDAYCVDVDRDWIALESMEQAATGWADEKGHWWMAYIFSPYMEKVITEHFGLVPENSIILTPKVSPCLTFAYSSFTVTCELVLLEFILRMQGFVHPLPIARTEADHYETLIEELEAEEESVIVVKEFTALVLSKTQAVNTLLVINEPSGILTRAQSSKMERT